LGGWGVVGCVGGCVCGGVGGWVGVGEVGGGFVGRLGGGGGGGVSPAPSRRCSVHRELVVGCLRPAAACRRRRRPPLERPSSPLLKPPARDLAILASAPIPTQGDGWLTPAGRRDTAAKRPPGTRVPPSPLAGRASPQPPDAASPGWPPDRRGRPAAALTQERASRSDSVLRQLFAVLRPVSSALQDYAPPCPSAIHRLGRGVEATEVLGRGGCLRRRSRSLAVREVPGDSICSARYSTPYDRPPTASPTRWRYFVHERDRLIAPAAGGDPGASPRSSRFSERLLFLPDHRLFSTAIARSTDRSLLPRDPHQPRARPSNDRTFTACRRSLDGATTSCTVLRLAPDGRFLVISPSSPPESRNSCDARLCPAKVNSVCDLQGVIEEGRTAARSTR